MGALVIGALMSVLGLLGLVLAAEAIDGGMYHFGFALFGFCTFFVFWLIKAFFDEDYAGR